MTDTQKTFAWTFAQGVVGSLVRTAVTFTTGYIALKWPAFDALLSPVTDDPATIATVVLCVTAFIMAIISTLWKLAHTNKVVAAALDAAAASVKEKP